MELVTDNNAVQREVSALHQLCESQGAFFHESLRMVVAEDGEIWLESKLPHAETKCLISLPMSCLPPVSHVTFKLVGDDLDIQSVEDGTLSDTQYRCLKHMLAIYNATGKIRYHRATFPWIALNDVPALRNRIAEGRRSAPKISELHDRISREGPSDDFIIHSFIGTRKYGALGNPVLMPFIDYANHDSRAYGFQPGPQSFGQDHRVSLLNCQPLNGSNEVCVRYTQLDSLDAYLTYGFVDQSSPIVRSVPTTLEAGDLDVRSRIGVVTKKELQSDIADLGPYVPNVFQTADGRTVLTHLLFPDAGSPYALRRVLNWSIRHVRGNLGLKRLRERVITAETALLQANRAYYDDLERHLDDTPTPAPARQQTMLRALIDHQRDILRKYEERLTPQDASASAP